MSLLSTVLSAFGVLVAVGIVGAFVSVFVIGDWRGPDAPA